jgi:hypothetical protein
MLRKPPHILVTTPESLFLLLTSARSREMLRTVRTVIVDEIHAVIGGAAARTSRCHSSDWSDLARRVRLRRPPHPANRPVGDAEANRRGRAVSGR